MSAFTTKVNKWGFRFEVEGDVTPERAAVTNPDAPGFGPAEGGLEEVSGVYLLDIKGKRIELPDFLQEELDERGAKGDLDEEIAEALAEDSEPDYDAIRDAREDR